MRQVTSKAVKVQYPRDECEVVEMITAQIPQTRYSHPCARNGASIQAEATSTMTHRGIDEASRGLLVLPLPSPVEVIPSPPILPLPPSLPLKDGVLLDTDYGVHHRDMRHGRPEEKQATAGQRRRHKQASTIQQSYPYRENCRGPGGRHLELR